jgi:hypothetical protein
MNLESSTQKAYAFFHTSNADSSVIGALLKIEPPAFIAHGHKYFVSGRPQFDLSSGYSTMLSKILKPFLDDAE